MEFYDPPEDCKRRECLLQGTPCTGIWWSVDGREHNICVDRNAHDPAFVFCPGNYKGGALSPLDKATPEVHCKHYNLLHLGEVIWGRRSRGLHYVDDFDPSEDRSVIVMYGEYRVLEKDRYKHVVNVNTTNMD